MIWATTAVLVTRGDRDVGPLVEPLKAFQEVIVWDNSRRRDFRVFGRFMGAAMASHSRIYVQDDDCVVDFRALLALHSDGHVTVNMPENRRPEYEGTGISLIGWGTVFEKERLGAFETYLKGAPWDELFERECDRVFTYLNRGLVRHVEVAFEHLPHAHGNDRMGREARHGDDLREIRRRLRSL